MSANTLRENHGSQISPGRSIIDLRRVTKTFAVGSGRLTALSEIDLQVNKGEFVAVVGKSGSGKSTLLNLIAGIDTPTSGEIFIQEMPIHALKPNKVIGWRGLNVGVVFQFFQLLPTLTVVENVMLPMDFCRVFKPREREERARALLEQVGVADQAYKFPTALSGGQQQRAAIARALANDPPIITADEPTGNLDSQTADSIIELFKELAGEGKTVIMVTHERDITNWVTHTITLADGEIAGPGAGETEDARGGKADHA